MKKLKLEPGDILINIDKGKDPFSVIKRWAVGPYKHVFLFLGRVKIIGHDVEIPLLFESMGRGCCLRSLSERYDQEVVVLRLKSEFDRKRIPKILREAIKLASDTQAYYDYLCVVKYAIPRLICGKLGLPMPLKYQRDPLMICSEACAEIFWRVGIGIVPISIIPLPSDFVESNLLGEAGRVTLSEAVV